MEDCEVKIGGRLESPLFFKLLYRGTQNDIILIRNNKEVVRVKLYRLLSLISLLTNKDKITVSELANELEVSKRTIYRDLDSLTMAGIPIISYSGYNGGISIADNFKFDKSVLSNNDIKNILLGLNSILSLDEDKEIKYLISRLIPKEMQKINEESDIIIDLSNWYSDNFSQEMINAFRKAIVNQQYVHIEYHSKSIASKRKIEPYKLIFKENGWYLYAYCLSRNAFRLFKLTRISSFELSSDTFARKRRINTNNICTFSETTKANVRKQELVKKHVVLECQPNEEEFLIEKFSAENLEWENDKLFYKFLSSNLRDTADLVISLQDKVKVIQPIELQIMVIEKIKRMNKVYKG